MQGRKNFKDMIEKKRVPQHIAIIMDGNGRWAKEQGQPRVKGHIEGATSVRKVLETCVEVGVRYLTLYAFSTENWNRPQEEVDRLMELLVQSLDNELPELKRQKVRLNAIGDLGRLPDNCQEKLRSAMRETAENDRITLTLALSYSSHWEIVNAVRNMIKEGVSAELLNEQTFENYLSTKGLPNPDLLIRTGGERRISNFLLWQLSYTELYFTDIYWPDFRGEELKKAILDYQKRERRYGKTSEQINET